MLNKRLKASGAVRKLQRAIKIFIGGGGAWVVDGEGVAVKGDSSGMVGVGVIKESFLKKLLK